MEKKEKTPLMKLSEIARIAHRKMRNDSEQLGFNQTIRLIIFYLMYKHDGATQVELVDHTKLSKPTISLTLQKMELDGLIIRKQDVVDLRNIRVYITEKGKETEKTFINIGENAEKYVFSILSNEENNELVRLLDKILQHVREEEE